MRTQGSLLLAGVALAALALGPVAHATPAVSFPVNFEFSGPSGGGPGTISGSGVFTVAPSTVAGDPANAYTISGASGFFSDPNGGVSNEPITGVLANDNPAGPPAGDSEAPGSFNYFSGGTYDNLFYAGNSPLTCNGYPFSGGFLDVYGALFTLKNGDVVNFWSNGLGSNPSSADGFYGARLLDSTGGVLDSSPQEEGDPTGIAASVPEPGSLGLLATALLMVGALAWRRPGTPAERPAV